MKSIKMKFWIIGVTIMSLGLLSCSTDEYDDWGNGEDNSGNSDSTYELLKDNISASVSYGDYGWNITINSKLLNVFPNKKINYGVECGYGSYKYYEHFTFDNGYLQKNDGKGKMTICYPVFVGNEYGDLWLYWHSYKALEAKKNDGVSLGNDEKDLWNEIVEMMSGKERVARSEFCGRLYAELDGRRYVYHTFGQIPDESNDGDSTGDDDKDESNSYEKPDVGFYDFTATKSSLKVLYKVYNKNDTDISSAKVYYGTSSNPTTYKIASLSGTLITANITGLKSGTTYYVKCVVTGKGGTTTTSTTKCITNYN